MGWAVLRDGEIMGLGCKRTKPESRKRGVRVADDDTERTQELARALRIIVEEYEISGVVVEMPSGGAKGARAISCMAKAGAIVATAVELLGLPAEWVTPAQVKKITGKRNASKAEVETAVLDHWPFATLPKIKADREHVVDALATYVAAKDGQLVRTLCA